MHQSMCMEYPLRGMRPGKAIGDPEVPNDHRHRLCSQTKAYLVSDTFLSPISNQGLSEGLAHMFEQPGQTVHALYSDDQKQSMCSCGYCGYLGQKTVRALG